MAQTLLVVVCVVGPGTVALVGLALRLGWQARRDQRRQDTLRALTARTSGPSVIEIHDVRDDGSQLRVRITPAPVPRWSSDE